MDIFKDEWLIIRNMQFSYSAKQAVFDCLKLQLLKANHSLGEACLVSNTMRRTLNFVRILSMWDFQIQVMPVPHIIRNPVTLKFVR